MGNTVPDNYLDSPSVSLPCDFSFEGLPIGLQVTAKPYQAQMALSGTRAYKREIDSHIHSSALDTAG